VDESNSLRNSVKEVEFKAIARLRYFHEMLAAQKNGLVQLEIQTN